MKRKKPKNRSIHYETADVPRCGGKDCGLIRFFIKENAADVVPAASEDGTCRVVCCKSKMTPHTITAENGMLRISSSREWTDVFNLRFEKRTVTVFLPANMYEKFSIETSTGDIEIRIENGN